MLPFLVSLIRVGRGAVAVLLLAGWAQAQSGEGYWKRQGEPVFVGKEGRVGDWNWKIDSRSNGHIALTDTCCGDTSWSILAQWEPPPDILREGEIPALPARAAYQRVTNPRGFGSQSQLVAFIKTPYTPFWQADVPMVAGKEVRGANTSVKVPGGGGSLTVVYRLMFATSYDLEFPYAWVKGAAPAAAKAAPAPAPAGRPHWKRQGEPVFVGKEGRVGDWNWKIDNRSNGHIALTDTCCGDTTLSILAQWEAPPDVLYEGDLPTLPARAAYQRITNPRGFGSQSQLVAFIKTPYTPFWQADVPMEVGKEVRGANTGVKVPGGGGSLTVVYRLMFATSYDLEFPYVWVP